MPHFIDLNVEYKSATEDINMTAQVAKQQRFAIKRERKTNYTSGMYFSLHYEAAHLHLYLCL